MITLDPDAQAYLNVRKRTSALSQEAPLKPENLREEERRLRDRYGDGPPMLSELVVPAHNNVPRHVILNPRADPEGVLVFFHGGGWVMGEPEDYLAVCRALAAGSGWSVVVADYRKAPENRFPAAFEDALALVRKFASGNARGGETPSTLLGVAGDSAGGNLAAAVSAYLANYKPGTLDIQVLVTPVLDTDLETASYRDPARQLTLTRENMAWFLDQYVPLHARKDWRVAPLHAPKPAALPPTLLVSVISDVLFSEVHAYLRRLKLAGVDVAHHEYSGQMHGFFQLYNVMNASEDAVKWISFELKEFGKNSSLSRQKSLFVKGVSNA